MLLSHPEAVWFIHKWFGLFERVNEVKKSVSVSHCNALMFPFMGFAITPIRPNTCIFTLFMYQMSYWILLIMAEIHSVHWFTQLSVGQSLNLQIFQSWQRLALLSFSGSVLESAKFSEAKDSLIQWVSVCVHESFSPDRDSLLCCSQDRCLNE